MKNKEVRAAQNDRLIGATVLAEGIPLVSPPAAPLQGNYLAVTKKSSGTTITAVTIRETTSIASQSARYPSDAQSGTRRREATIPSAGKSTGFPRSQRKDRYVSG
jgi:hypothetical protein